MFMILLMIISTFERKHMIKKRKSMINNMEYQVKKLSNKAKFILEQCEDIIDLRKKKRVRLLNY